METFSLATGRPPCWWVVPVSSGPMPFVTMSLVFMTHPFHQYWVISMVWSLIYSLPSKGITFQP